MPALLLQANMNAELKVEIKKKIKEDFLRIRGNFIQGDLLLVR